MHGEVRRGDSAVAPDAVISNPAAWLLDERALVEAIAVAASEQLDLEGSGSLAQGVDSSMDIPESRGPAPSSTGRLTYTVEEAAELLGVSRALAYEAVRRGEIPSIRIGRRILVPRSRFALHFGFDPQEPWEPEA